VQLLANDIRGNVLPSDTWSFGPMLEYIRSRADVDNSRVDDMQNVDASVMLGVFGGVKIDRWSSSIELRADVADSNGFLATLNGGYDLPINEQLRLGFGAFATYADGDYMNTYFSVDSGDAARLMGLVRYTRLVGDAEDSPVVDDEGNENQFLVGVLVKYSF
jgi:outer membrane protein